MKLTDKQMKQIQDEINKINQIVIKREEDPQSFRRIKELRAIREKNEEINMKLVDCCFFGPLSVKDLLKGTDYEIELQDRQCSLEIIIALENVLGKSTIMEYDKSKNIVEAKTPKDGYKLEYDPKDVELGLWDKICAFFGIKTDHAKKVEFAQKSIQAQKDKLDGFNRNAVKKKKDKFIENHKDFAKRNEAVLKDAEKTEKGFKKLFFGKEKVEDYKFKNGDTLTALSACIAMYHQEGGKDIAKMSLEEINREENADLRKRLMEIGKEYKEKFIEGKGIEDKFKYLDDFLFTSSKYSEKDRALLERIATTREFEIDWNKAESNIKATEQKKELAGAQSLAMLKTKAEIRKFLGEKLPNGQKSGFDKPNEKDMEHFNAYKDVREYKLFMDEMSKGNYGKANEHLGNIKGLVGFDKKLENYNEFLDKVDSMVSQKELNAPTKENKGKNEPQMEEDDFALH